MPSFSLLAMSSLVADAATYSHVVINHHCLFPALSRYFPLRFHSRFCCCHQLPFHLSSHKERGWLATIRPSARVVSHGQDTARPPIGEASHDQPPCRAGHPRPNPLAGAAANMRSCSQAWLAPMGIGSARDHATRGSCPRPGRRGRLLASRPQGAAPRPGLPPIRAAAPAGATPAQGGTARPRGAARGQQRLPQGRLPTPMACSTVACVGQR
ncbi:hypothetical protein BHE74_00020689 [Ensete ventricosum]|nr:hypothetical protein BHE74_00020689 [Ensete ventricosum]